ncbi:MAG: ATP-binding cassette domain-containing protein [Acidobacteriota bacterium]|nr:ATP-binding cassette domain-containing protein [Acidobacteriota bacterium]
MEAVRYSVEDQKILDLPYWKIQKGEHSLVLGPSGSGKTTLIHLMAGLLRPDRGRIKISVQDIAGLSPAAMDRFRGRHIGLIFQKLYLIPSLSVWDNLKLAAKFAGLPFDREWADSILRGLSLAHKAKSRPSELSSGEAQRAAIARAVLNRPKIILADEPTSALDDATCDNVADLLVEQASRGGATLVVATHDTRLKDHFKSRLDLEGS